MSHKRPLDKKQIHARAVLRGQTRGFENEAKRLAAADASESIDIFIDALRPEIWEGFDDSSIMDAIATRLWLDWVTVEYRNAVLAGEPAAGAKHAAA